MNLRWGAALVAISFNSATALAQDSNFSVSGFGTLGYAQSDQPYTYQRFISDRGTFWRDSVAGLQVDAKFLDKFGATMQIKVAPASDTDSEYQGTLSWAFLSWRPTNDWLFRLGKQRIPLYLYSETVDVGVTYDFARLPTEMYSISPSNDFTGLSIGKSWGIEGGDATLDGYWGKSTSYFRFWIRDNIPPLQNSGAQFYGLDVEGGGLVLTYKRNEDTYRIGVNRAVIKLRDGSQFPTTFPFAPIAPGVGYYQVDNSLPGPGVPTRNFLIYNIATVGADVGLGSGFRLVTEFARTLAPNTDISAASSRGYVSLLDHADKWTPYVIYAFLRSQSAERDLYNNVNYNTVPDFIPGAALINASQRSGADHLIAYDQSSWALGTSYSFSATSKIKAEYMRSHIGQMSGLVDGPPGSNIRDQNINVYSLSISFAF